MKQLIQAQGESGKADMSGKWKAGGGRELSTFHLLPSTSARPSRRAFTLIELLGVMAIIGILSAVILPSMISKIEEANTVNEDAAQSTIADAILKGIRANARFPNPNVSPTDASFGWMTLAQNFYPGGVNALRYVFPEHKTSPKLSEECTSIQRSSLTWGHLSVCRPRGLPLRTQMGTEYRMLRRPLYACTSSAVQNPT